MGLTQEQVKGKIKHLANENGADARVLMRIYMMERFLERVANSSYADDFVIKGGILVTSMVGVAMRSTMDIDTSIRNINLTEEELLRVIGEIAALDMEDDVSFKVKSVSSIMDEMEYPGIRIAIDAYLGQMVTPIKIDVSTGDVITPGAIGYNYNLMLEKRAIKLWSYNLETILAEKMQTILSRGVLNTRMRDFYDVYTLTVRYEERVDALVLKQAFKATCTKRSTTDLLSLGDNIIDRIQKDNNLETQWKSYQRKYEYAREISFDEAINKVKDLYEMLE